MSIPSVPFPMAEQPPPASEDEDVDPTPDPGSGSAPGPARKPGPRPTAASVPVEVLTDEELDVLAGPSFVVSPTLDDLSAVELAACRRTAFRGLVARGIVDPPGPEATADAVDLGADRVELDLQIRNDVLSVLTLRRAAGAVVAVARTTSTSQDFWYAHVVEEIVLLEEVGREGLHRYAVASTDDLAELVYAAAVHPEATDAEGTRIELPGSPDAEAPEELAEVLGQAYLRSDVIVVVRDGEPDATRALPSLDGLFTGPRGSWSILARQSSPRAWAEPATLASMRERIGEIAAAAAAAPRVVTS